MPMRRLWILFALATVSSLMILSSCGSDDQEKSHHIPKAPVVDKPKSLPKPAFNADSAYAFVKAQVDFGPRVPNSKAQKECAAYLASKLKSYGFDVIEQKGSVKAFNDVNLNIINIIGQWKPELTNRIMLFAHWDTRPFADRDVQNTNEPIDGANDGASGVGVLLEVARQIQAANPEIGVDIMFFDAEDYGQPMNSMIRKEDTWCLGTQYWTRHLHKEGYAAKFGILLDMVGAKGAVFPMEGTSRHYASGVQQKVWDIAARLGHGNLFIKKQTGETIDDHLYVNKNVGIPSIDIVHYDPNQGDYFPFHHKHGDNMDQIDKTILQAVGQVLLATIQLEQEA